MAIDVTSGPHPAFATDTSVGTTTTQIRAAPFTSVVVFADAAIYVFNGQGDGNAAASAADRVALTAAEAAQGVEFVVGGAVAASTYGTLEIAAQTGTATVRVWTRPPEVVAP